MNQPSASPFSSYQKTPRAEDHGIPPEQEENVLATAASSEDKHETLYASLISWKNGQLNSYLHNVGPSDDGDDDDGAPAQQQLPHLNKCQERLISMSPDLAPIPWSIINLLLLAWSGGLMIAILYFEYEIEDGGRKRRAHRTNRWRNIYRTDLYVVWNLVTTWVWCWEMGLKILYRKSKSITWTNLTEFGVAIYFLIANLAEFVVAVYFLFDSLTMLQLIFDLKSDKDVKGEFFDGLISFLGYFYELVESLYLFRKKWKEEHYGVELQQQQVPI